MDNKRKGKERRGLKRREERSVIKININKSTAE